MGTRNAAVRKLAIPDLTTTVLTLTISGIGADSSLANGNNPRLREGLRRWPQMFLVRRWVRPSYITRSQRPCGLGQRSPPRAVRHYFARCARPISSDGESRFSAGELYLTHRSTVQTTVAEPDANRSLDRCRGGFPSRRRPEWLSRSAPALIFVTEL